MVGHGKILTRPDRVVPSLFTQVKTPNLLYFASSSLAPFALFSSYSISFWLALSLYSTLHE